jgi:hypothetical protein
MPARWSHHRRGHHSAWTWLKHQPASQIHNWDNLVCTFVGNFQGTYTRPGNSRDLRTCTQKPDESLQDFIRRFSKRCTELPSVAQSEIVHAFLEGTTCWDLVRELRRSSPVDSNELFDIATSFASGEEAVGAIFDGKKGKRVDDVTTPPEIIPYYRLNHSFWSLSNNKEVSR